MPDRPKFAPGVKPAGKMKESAFKDPPWLIEREGAGYVQVTEILYRIAEQCTGEQTLEQIAARSSETTGRKISADNVRQLVQTQLLAKGLVEDANGRVAKTAGAGRSLLRINMRTKEISPAVIAPVANALRVLFLPPILLLALAAIIGVEAWLYLSHGVGGSLHDALYAPGLAMVLLLIMVVAAVAHEFGHAAALHYGGGQVKGMGAGLYMVYPAFYTDVTDNYKLSRWARVRTDLGGFYFNLLFSLGVIGVYALTGFEFLLLVVVLINFEIIRQLLPFVRMDGYWVLADVTGIPDFFSQMTAYLRSVLPIKSEGRKLPELKWWGKLVFALYILITIPLLGFLIFMLVNGLPRILATAWDSFQQQVATASEGLGKGDVIAMAAAALQILALALPVLGIFYTLYSLGRTAVTFVIRWGQHSTPKRLAGSAGIGGVAAGLVLLWMPQVPGTQLANPLYVGSNFRPIQANERGALQDALRGVVATVEPSAAGVRFAGTPILQRTPGAGGTPTAGATAAATAGATAAAATSVAGQTALTPLPARTNTPAPGPPAAGVIPTTAAVRTATATAVLTVVPTNTAAAVGGTGQTAPQPTSTSAPLATQGVSTPAIGSVLSSPTATLVRTATPTATVVR